MYVCMHVCMYVYVCSLCNLVCLLNVLWTFTRRYVCTNCINNNNNNNKNNIQTISNAP